MAVKIKISKPGYDVFKVTDPRELIFDSDLNHLKTALSDTFQTTLASNANSVETVPHGLGYKPMGIVYFRQTTGDNWFTGAADPENVQSRHLAPANCFLYVDDTNAYIKVVNKAGATRTFEVKYEVFYEGDQ